MFKLIILLIFVIVAGACSSTKHVVIEDTNGHRILFLTPLKRMENRYYLRKHITIF